jgi:hypothetical protein
MPAPTATAFRPGRRSHRGRLGRRSHRRRLGRRSHRRRVRVPFAGRCSTSWETSSSASEVSAAWRSRTRRARAASARASALATSSSASASEMGVSAPESSSGRDCGPSGSVTSPRSSQWSASGASGERFRDRMVTSWPLRIVHGEAAYHFPIKALRCHPTPAFVALKMRKYSFVRQPGGVPFQCHPGPTAMWLR